MMVCYDLEAILARVKISAHRVYSDMYSVQWPVRSVYSMSGAECQSVVAWTSDGDHGGVRDKWHKWGDGDKSRSGG